MEIDMSSKIKIYSAPWCGFCKAALRLLDQIGADYENINVDENPGVREKISAENGNYRTIPMIFIEDQFIGGFTEFQKYLKDNQG